MCQLLLIHTTSFVLTLSLFFLVGCFAPQGYTGRDIRGNIEIELWVSKSCPTRNETVTNRGTAKNEGTQPFIIEIPDRPVLDLVMNYETSEGKQVRRWSDGKALTPELTRLELAPGESKSIEIRWTPSNERGDIRVKAQLYDHLGLLDDPLSPYSSLRIYPSCGGYLNAT